MRKEQVVMAPFAILYGPNKINVSIFLKYDFYYQIFFTLHAHFNPVTTPQNIHLESMRGFLFGNCIKMLIYNN